jgi:hypothetical protein
MLKKPDRLIELLFFPIVATITLLLSLADLFGFLSFIPASRIPMLTLSIVSLILSSLMLIQRRGTETQELTRNLYSKNLLEQLDKEVLDRIDPGLLKVFKDDYFLNLIEFLQVAIKENKVQVNHIEHLRHYYIRTLRRYPKAKFLSTQCSSVFSLWKDPVIEEETTSFIRKGGKLERILLVKDAQELASQEVQEVIEHQRKIGIQVHIAYSSGTPSNLKKNFIVESRGKIAWEIHEDGEHIKAMVTTDKQLVTSYCRIFEKLQEGKID